jgi:hypothetical protein
MLGIVNGIMIIRILCYITRLTARRTLSVIKEVSKMARQLCKKTLQTHKPYYDEGIIKSLDSHAPVCIITSSGYTDTEHWGRKNNYL